MKIFDKRPLSLILCMLLGGFVFFSVFNDAWKIAISSIGLLILLFALFVPLKEFKGRVLTVICSAAILVGCLLSFLYFDLYYFIDEDLKGEVEICGVVTESESISYGKELTIIAETIDGETTAAGVALGVWAENISDLYDTVKNLEAKVYSRSWAVLSVFYSDF